MPSQVDADAWARERTLGMIEQFPLEIDELTRLILASALATDSQLDGAAVGGGETGCSRSATGSSWSPTPGRGLVAAPAPPSSSALDVYSVIAAPDVPPDGVDAAAHQVAAMLAGDEGSAGRVPVEELADGHAWRVSDRHEQRFGPSVQAEWQTYLPAWSAESDHDLRNAPGMAEVFATLSGFARPEDQPVTFEPRQAAVASYTRTGFKAAAVTAVGMRAAGVAAFHDTLVRRVERFASTVRTPSSPARRSTGPEAWRGVPVFSAWVIPICM